MWVDREAVGGSCWRNPLRPFPPGPIDLGSRGMDPQPTFDPTRQQPIIQGWGRLIFQCACPNSHHVVLRWRSRVRGLRRRSRLVRSHYALSTPPQLRPAAPAQFNCLSHPSRHFGFLILKHIAALNVIIDKIMGHSKIAP